MKTVHLIAILGT